MSQIYATSKKFILRLMEDSTPFQVQTAGNAAGGEPVIGNEIIRMRLPRASAETSPFFWAG